jgi:hypothetical protein
VGAVADFLVSLIGASEDLDAVADEPDPPRSERAGKPPSRGRRPVGPTDARTDLVSSLWGGRFSMESGKTNIESASRFIGRRELLRASHFEGNCFTCGRQRIARQNQRGHLQNWELRRATSNRRKLISHGGHRNPQALYDFGGCPTWAIEYRHQQMDWHHVVPTLAR